MNVCIHQSDIIYTIAYRFLIQIWNRFKPIVCELHKFCVAFNCVCFVLLDRRALCPPNHDQSPRESCLFVGRNTRGVNCPVSTVDPWGAHSGPQWQVPINLHHSPSAFLKKPQTSWVEKVRPIIVINSIQWNDARINQVEVYVYIHTQHVRCAIKQTQHLHHH